MRWIWIISLFFSVNCLAQYPYSNRPDIVNPMIDEFIMEAEIRGIDVRSKLGELDSIIIKEQPQNNKPLGLSGFKADGIFWTRGHDKWIEIKRSLVDDRLEDSGSRFTLFFHELGHLFGLADCYTCRYNIMAGQSYDRKNFLFRDLELRAVFLDIYMKAIQDPETYNKNHIHY